MFPSSHDIVPEFLTESVQVIRNLLDNGNKVLIVSKPRKAVVETLCANFQDDKKNLLFRFTITALDPELARFWEPEAPAPAERIESLSYTFRQGYATSVSCEPYLGTVDHTCDLVAKVTPWVSDTIWIGKANIIPRKLNSHIQGFTEALTALKANQTDQEVLRLVKQLSKNKKVKLKDSIQEVLAAYPNSLRGNRKQSRRSRLAVNPEPEAQLTE